MRIYLPATLTTLREIRGTGAVGPAPVTAFAVTPTLREWYAEGDLEELEYAAFADAARACLRLLDRDPGAPRRRVVISADVADGAAEARPDLDRSVVRLAATVPLAALASVHVDGAEAEVDVRAAVAVVLDADLGDADAEFVVDSAEGHELEWYDISELDLLLDSEAGDG